MTFQDLFASIFQDYPGPFTSICHVFPGLFNHVNIKQVRFSYTFTKLIALYITVP